MSNPEKTPEEKAALAASIKATLQEMKDFAKVLREGSEEQVRKAFERAATRKAVSMERSKETTLAAAFLFDYAHIVVREKRYERVCPLLAELVLKEQGLRTLLALHQIDGPVHRVVNVHLGPHSDLSAGELDQVVRRATPPKA